MIEVLFGECEAANLKICESQLCKDNEIICIPFMLDIGDIKKNVNSEYRKELLYKMYTQNRLETDAETLSELYDMPNKYSTELERLKEFATNKEKIRLWYSNTPSSLCGFYFVCNILQDYNTQVSYIKLPAFIKRPDKIVYYSDWSEVCLNDLPKYFPLEKDLSSIELKIYSERWVELVEDNSPLRAIINGQLIGVSEDFYDNLILKELSNKKLEMITLIGILMGKYQFGIGDSLYSYRIAKMIESGQIMIVKESTHKYNHHLRRVNNHT